MAFASGTGVKLYYCMESGGALPGTPAWLPIRFVSENLARTTAQIQSNEISSDRQKEVDRQGTYSTQGTIAAELGLASHDDLIEAAMQSTWAPVATKTATTISAAAADNSFNDSGNGFVTAGFAVGQRVISSGFTGNVANNSATGRVITALTAGKMTFGGTDGDDIVDDAAGESVVLTTKSDKLTIGSTRRTFSILERHTDISVDYIYRGCEASALGLVAALNARVALTFGIIGKTAEAYTVGSDTFAAEGTADPFVTTDASLTEGGSAIAIVTELSLNLDNGMSPSFAIGTRPAVNVGNGMGMVSGQLTAYLTTGVLYAKHLNETSTSISASFTDGTDTFAFSVGKVAYIQAQKGVNGPGDILPQFTFSAGKDSAGQTLTITRSSP